MFGDGVPFGWVGIVRILYSGTISIMFYMTSGVVWIGIRTFLHGLTKELVLLRSPGSSFSTKHLLGHGVCVIYQRVVYVWCCWSCCWSLGYNKTEKSQGCLWTGKCWWLVCKVLNKYTYILPWYNQVSSEMGLNLYGHRLSGSKEL